MTESVDKALNAARERGWIGYEERLAEEIAALREEIEQLENERDEDRARIKDLESIPTHRKVAALRDKVAELEDELAKAAVPDDHEAEERAKLQARIAELESAIKKCAPPGKFAQVALDLLSRLKELEANERRLRAGLSAEQDDAMRLAYPRALQEIEDLFSLTRGTK